jgi:hypothetical protein
VPVDEASLGPKIPEAGTATNDGWREYELLVGLYKFYIELAVKAIAAYFAITGAIITVVLANVRQEKVIKYALLVPFFMSLLFGLAAREAKPMVKELRVAVDEVAGKLHLTVVVHVKILQWVVRGLFWLVLLALLLLAGMFAWLVKRY